MTAFLTVLLGLGVPGLLPALAVAPRSPVVILLAPVIGGVFAALAAELELGIAGSLFGWYLVIALAVNLAVIAWWIARRIAARAHAAPPRAGCAVTAARRPSRSWSRAQIATCGWYFGTVATLLGALAVPLIGLRSHLIGWDSNSIWLTHALMISGGHHELLTSLKNPAYSFSNPDYPPLVPAVGALAFKFFGMSSLLVAIDTTVFLTACALGVAGVGIAAAAGHTRPLPRAIAIATGGAVCIAGFAVASQYGIDGHADLMWAAAAVAAIVWGLVLPRSTQALVVAWICAIAASLTKNEGLTTALIVLGLICLRYRPLRLRHLRARGDSPDRHAEGLPSRRPPLARWPREWAVRAAFVLLPAVPGLAWAGEMRLIGIGDTFFASSSGQSLASRAAATTSSMAGQLKIAPVAVLLLVAGSVVLRRYRERARVANPAWLWLACLGSLAVIFATYVFGADPIGWWLQTSVHRTTIFPQIVLYADIGIWLVTAVAGAFGHDVETWRGAAGQDAESMRPGTPGWLRRLPPAWEAAHASQHRHPHGFDGSSAVS
jgi:hypothetical protein